MTKKLTRETENIIRVSDIGVRLVHLSEIDDNPFGFDRPEDNDYIEQLAQSIKATKESGARPHGLIHYPNGRYVEDTGRYQSADGGCRRRAFSLLWRTDGEEWCMFPLIVSDLTDEQMADVAWRENKDRKDLDTLTLALWYKQQLELFNQTQEVLAQRCGITQSAISHALRLLELPPEVQALVQAGTITGRHGRALLPLLKFPQALEKVVSEMNDMSVAEVERSVASKMRDSAPAITDGYPQPKFDIRPCRKCKDRIEYTDPWDRGEIEICCGLPSCWNAKQKSAEEKAEVNRQEKIDKMVADLQEKAPVEVTGKKVRKGKAAESIEKAEQSKVLDLSKVGYGGYQVFYSHYELDKPEECETCVHRVVGAHKGWRNDDAELVCTMPKCYTKKKTAASRQRGKEQREADAKRTEGIDAVFRVMRENKGSPLLDRQILLLVGRYVIDCYSQGRSTKQAAKEYGLEEYDWRTDVREWLAEKTDDEIAWIFVREAYLRRNKRDQVLLHCELAERFGLPKPKVKCYNCGQEHEGDAGKWIHSDGFWCTACHDSREADNARYVLESQRRAAEGEGCGHQDHEDCMTCIVCGRCREDLDEDDTCMECGGVDHNADEPPDNDAEEAGLTTV